ncbi:MAG: hypothetical protein M3N95_05730 [Actinomycetota bacterium]|nr:hypothetical protein [Actinomycetota bacterium]
MRVRRADIAESANKRDRGRSRLRAEAWMPPSRAHDARFVTILAKYRLPVIAADKTAMTAVLRTCK